MQQDLTVLRGAALYVGALLGPGLLLLPGLAAQKAGPSSVIAWAGLLVVSGLIAIVFGALGLRRPSASGVRAYTEMGLGPTAGRVFAWCFLAGAISGAPIVCLICGNYVATLFGGGRLAVTLAASVLLVVVLLLTTRGVRASSGIQVVLVGLLLALIVAAVVGASSHMHHANWTPFAPHGAVGVGSAAATLMLSFVGWEAVAPLTARFANPRRQLPRVIAIAFVATSLIYLALAVVTVGALGSGAGTSVPLSAMLQLAVGPAGRIFAAVVSILLALGATNAYLNGAASLGRTLVVPCDDTASANGFPTWLVVAIASSGVALIGLIGIGVLSTNEVVAVPTTFFVAVYFGCMISAARVLPGALCVIAIVAALAVTAVLVFCGLALIPVALVVLAVAGSRWHRGRRDRIRCSGFEQMFESVPTMEA
jgi:amino acid efflux transporter